MLIDHQMMQRALQLAKQGEYSARPNPMVGCVMTQGDQIIAEGLHWQAGLAHAERKALEQNALYAGATCYITLEPCVHHGRTPPCVDALIAAKIKRVVIATPDPNPVVAGKGIAALQKAGIEVTVGVLAKEARAQNIGFFSRMLRNRPYIRAKVGMSLDGKIAMKSGESQWITNAHSRLLGHQLRAKSGAIVTSQATVKRDDCLMTVRGEALPNLSSGIEFKQPLRVVVDSQLAIMPQAKILSGDETVVVISHKVNAEQEKAWLSKINPSNVRLIRIEDKNNHVNLHQLMMYLGEREINDVLIESGPRLLGAFISEGLLDELSVFIAPKLLGSDAIGMVDLPGIETLQEHIALSFDNATLQAGEMMITSKISNFLDTL